jgi:hypothetical protein
MAANEYNEILLCQNEYLLDHTFITIHGLHTATLDDFVNGKKIVNWIWDEPFVQRLEPTTQTASHGKFFLTVPKQQYHEAVKYIDHELPKFFRAVPSEHKIAGYEYPCRPDVPKPSSPVSTKCGELKRNIYRLERRTEAELEHIKQPPPRKFGPIPFATITKQSYASAAATPSPPHPPETPTTTNKMTTLRPQEKPQQPNTAQTKHNKQTPRSSLQAQARSSTNHATHASLPESDDSDTDMQGAWNQIQNLCPNGGPSPTKKKFRQQKITNNFNPGFPTK